MSRSVLIIDPSSVCRLGLVTLLGRDPSIDVIGQVSSVPQSQRVLQSFVPALVILGAFGIGQSVLAGIADLRSAAPGIRVVLLLPSASRAIAQRALAAGAVGCFSKQVAPARLLASLRALLDSGQVLRPTPSSPLASTVARRQRPSFAAPSQFMAELTTREREVLALVADGLSNRDISRRLSVSEGTIKVHMKGLLRKMGFRSRVQAAIWAASQSQPSRARAALAKEIKPPRSRAR